MMPDQMLVNPAALEPLFSPWEEPTKHRIRGDKPGEPAKIISGRRQPRERLSGQIFAIRHQNGLAPADNRR